jgi:hypothetical protein
MGDNCLGDGCSLNHIGWFRSFPLNRDIASRPFVRYGMRSLFLSLTITGAVTGGGAAVTGGGAAVTGTVTATDVRFRRPGAAVDGLSDGG